MQPSAAAKVRLRRSTAIQTQPLTRTALLASRAAPAVPPGMWMQRMSEGCGFCDQQLSNIHKAAMGRAVSRSPKESCCSPA